MAIWNCSRYSDRAGLELMLLPTFAAFSASPCAKGLHRHRMRRGTTGATTDLDTDSPHGCRPGVCRRRGAAATRAGKVAGAAAAACRRMGRGGRSPGGHGSGLHALADLPGRPACGGRARSGRRRRTGNSGEPKPPVAATPGRPRGDPGADGRSGIAATGNRVAAASPRRGAAVDGAETADRTRPLYRRSH